MIKLVLMTIMTMLTAGPLLARPAPAVLVSATPVAGAPEGAHAFRIIYHTKTEQGATIQATGLVLVPDSPSPRTGRDTVAWTHGTTGIADACSPSGNKWRFSIIAGLSQLLQRGYVVVAPDYAGLGGAGVHPFLIGKDTAYAVLDAVRASRDVPGANSSGRFALWGESQGGHAALWSARLADSYAPDLRLVGVAAAAPATDLVANIAGGTNAGVRALMTSYAGVAWSQIYGVSLSTVTGKVGQDLMHRLAKQCVTLDGFKVGTKIGLARMTLALRNVDLAKLPQWGALMRDNSVQPIVLSTPLLIAQGSADVIIAPDVTRSFVQRICKTGQKVRFIELAGGDHVTIAKRTADETIPWLADRFAGKIAPDDCRSL